jgi:hypothetical protein
MLLKHAIGFASLLTALVVSPASAGVRMSVETVDQRAGGPTETAQVWIDGDRVRLESTSPGAGSADQAIIFLGKQQELWQLDLADKHYTRIDREQLEAIGEQLSAARREAEARLAGLPPEQRQMVERMLGLGPNSTAPVSEEIRKTDQADEVDGKPCKQVQLLRNGVVSGEACVAAWKTIGLSRLDFRVFKKLGEFQEALRDSVGALPTGNLVTSQPFSVFDQLDGFPLRIRSLEKGNVRSESHFRRFEKQEVDAALFDVPEGFSEQPLPMAVPSR